MVGAAIRWQPGVSTAGDAQLIGNGGDGGNGNPPGQATAVPGANAGGCSARTGRTGLSTGLKTGRLRGLIP